MNVYVVTIKDNIPEGAFETRKLAEEYIVEAKEEHPDNKYFVYQLEVVKASDRPTSSDFLAAGMG